MSEVWFILLDGFDLFETVAARHAFELANVLLLCSSPSATYVVRLFTNATTPVRSNGEVALNAQRLPDELACDVDRVIVAGNNDAARALQHPNAAQVRLMAWLARHRARIGRIAAIGETAFVLTQSALREARATAPNAIPPSIAGSSGMELALRMITNDLGHRAAQQVAQLLLPSPERFGAPFRFRSSLGVDARVDERILTLNRWMASHLRLRLTNE